MDISKEQYGRLTVLREIKKFLWLFNTRK